MSLESPAILSHLSSWLTCFDLCALRILNRWFFNEVPRQTWELTACNICSLTSVKQLVKIFPHMWCLRIQNAHFQEIGAMEALVLWLDQSSEVRELELTRVGSVSDFPMHFMAEKLTKVRIQQCYQVLNLAIVAPNINTLVIEHCPVIRFHANTSLPQLKKLSLSSRSFTAVECQNLITKILPQSPALKNLSLARCSQLELVQVDSEYLPALRHLDLRGCPILNRVHVTSELLDTLLLSPNLSLQYVVLDLKGIRSLDLSFLKNLTHLYISAPSLRRLTLRGCDQLTRDTTDVNCPNLHALVLQGTILTDGDLNRHGVTTKVYA